MTATDHARQRGPALARGPWLAAAAIAMGATVASGPAAAHPHVFVESSTSIVFDDDGRIDRVRHAWRFDPFYSTFAIQGFDTDANGLLSREELAPLSEENTRSLKAFDFFSFLYEDEAERAFGEVTEDWLEYDPESRQLTLYFELALAEPADPYGHKVVLDVFDPEYFVAFSMYEALPFSLVDAPADCRLEMEKAGDLDPLTATMLAAIPPDQSIPEEYRSLTRTLSNTAIVSCGTTPEAAGE